jgi:hypothetical protein
MTRCIEILRECGHLPTGPGFGMVNFCEIPEGGADTRS